MQFRVDFQTRARAQRWSYALESHHLRFDGCENRLDVIVRFRESDYLTKPDLGRLSCTGKFDKKSALVTAIRHMLLLMQLAL